MQEERIQDMEVLLGHSFRNRGYLVNALSHSSIKNDERPSNERLEFLGDSVLGLIVSETLYRRFPDDDEGTMTRIKSQAVSRATLQRIAVAMGLDRYILVGKGVMKREIPASLLGNLFEAIVGAIYLDSGLASARKFILRHLDVVMQEIVEDRAEKNYKSLLQHHCQRELGAVPMYRVLREAGPAHNRYFDVAVLVGGKEYGRARAASKKEAEQGSARGAMIHFKAVDETAKQSVRGAGTLLRSGPGASTRKRSGRRRSDSDEKPPETRQRSRRSEPTRRKEPEAAEAKPATSRRRRRSKKPDVVEAVPAENAPPKKKAKRKSSKAKTKKTVAAKPAADAPRVAEGDPPKKKTRRRGTRGGRKKKKAAAAKAE